MPSPVIVSQGAKTCNCARLLRPYTSPGDFDLKFINCRLRQIKVEFRSHRTIVNVYTISRWLNASTRATGFGVSFDTIPKKRKKVCQGGYLNFVRPV